MSVYALAANQNVKTIKPSTTIWRSLVDDCPYLDIEEIEDQYGILNNREFCLVVDRLVQDACDALGQMCNAFSADDSDAMPLLLENLSVSASRAGALSIVDRTNDIRRHFDAGHQPGWASFNRHLESLRAELDAIWTVATQCRKLSVSLMRHY